MNAPLNDVHPDEAGLLRMLDDQAELPERTNIEQHVEACEECALAFDELRHASNTLKNEFGFDVILPPGRVPAGLTRRREWESWKVAAGIVILLAATSALQPVRAWMVSGWHSVVDIFVGTETVSAPEPPTPVASQPAGAVVSFTPRSPRLVIDVSSWQEAGELRIVVSARRDVSAQVLLAGSPEHMTILPSDGISITNTPESTSSYRIGVPNTLEQISVRIAGVQVVQLAPAAGDDLHVVSLTSR